MRVPLVALLLCFACAGPSQNEMAEASSGPNVILILADDLGFADVGFQGARDFATPNIDRLAASGIRFTSGYVSHPFCSPSRAGLLTGRYQHRFGHIHNPKFRAGEGLPLAETLLPEMLGQAGYVSGIVGKWHLGDAPQFRPRERGFDEFFGLLGGGHDYFKSEGSDAREYLIPLSANGEEVPVDGYLTEQLSGAALDFVRRHSERPFFLYLSYNAPHGPLQAPPALMERVKSIEEPRRQTYAAMVTSLDDGVGDLLDLIEQLELAERTLIFFLSDNGGPTPANASDNTPLRGTKGTVYEGGVRVPFVISWPGTLASGERYDPPVSALDIFPTTLAAAGVDLPPNLDGVDLLPFLTGMTEATPHQELFWYSRYGAQYAVRTPDRKFVRVLERESEVYAIVDDPGETLEIGRADGAAAALESSVEEWHSAHPQPAWPGTSREIPIHPNTALSLGAEQPEIDAWVAGTRR